ncbi:hypothetical protein UA08_04922 [Talaromyces atroroseus]|uniref:Uncharacterized protein n=1 Tax=Talaromyces atroroseus TaxID=1441469 RepID=A0A225B1Q6_TALAT|nr:hypothetical protein UA08_04922 [Talaromyces atroroseus]OKL59747.1 hypothetical protein UA08_04922 [Talaromyces atroroseus]
MPPKCLPEAENAFGPAVGGGCSGGFDFTLLFEQTILSILPAAAFLVVSPLRIRYLLKQGIYTRTSFFRVAKLVVATGFAAAQLGLLVLWTEDKGLQTRGSVPAAALEVVAGLSLGLLSWVEDSRSVKPSSLLSVYLLFTLLFDVAQARTLWLLQQEQSKPIKVLFSISVGLKSVFLALETKGKRAYLETKYQDLPPESTSGIINRSFMWWLNHLFFRGFKSLLTLDDLNRLDPNLHSASLSHSAQVAWQQRRRPERRFEVPFALCRALWWPLASAAIPRLFLIGFTFAQPFLLQTILEWLGQGPNVSRNEGYGLLGATVLIYLGLAISNLHYNHTVYRFLTMFRGAVSSLIYGRALHIPDGRLDDRSAAITLMTTDIDRISACLINLNECWARLIEVAVGISILAMRIGWICVVPVIVTLGKSSGIGSIEIAKRIGPRQKIWVDAVQNRIAITSSLLSNIHTVRRMGWSHAVAEIIQKRQARETHLMEGFRWSIVWQNVVQNLPWALAPALTFAVYTSLGDSLDATTAFTNLSIITLLTDPAAKLLSAIPSTSASLGCFDRIQDFLVIPTCQEVQASDLIPGPTRVLADVTEIHAVESQNSCSSQHDPLVTMKDVTILPAPSSQDYVLQNVNLDVYRGSFVFFIGEVGSGKSSLLRAMLGHAACKGGSIRVPLGDMAYCAQTPWLLNVTIRAAICGLTNDDDDDIIDINWYQSVIRSCFLDHDLKLLDRGDRTQIGSGSGAVLSGGQMQRVSLARALYSRKGLLLLDDVFSALDNTTKKHIMAILFGKGGLLREMKSTVMLVTNDTEYLSYADEIFALSKGNLRKLTPGAAISKNNIFHITLPDEARNDTPTPSAKEKSGQVSKENQRNDLTRVTGDVAVYKYYFKSIGLVKTLVFLLFAGVHVFCSTFSQIWLEWWSKQGGGQKGLYVSVYMMLALFNSIGNGGYVWAILVLISPSTSRRLHYRLLKAVRRASSLFLSTTDSGVILNRFSQDMSLIEGQLPIGAMVFISTGLVASGSGYMTITIPFLLLALILLQHVYLRTSRQLRLLDLESRSPLYTHFMETISGLSTIQAFRWQDRFQEKNFRLLDASQRPYYLLYCVQRWLVLVLDLIVAAEAIVLVTLAVTLRSETSVGLVGVSLNNILSFGNSLSAVTQGWTQLEVSLGSISRVREFDSSIKSEPEVFRDGELPDEWPGKGAIKFSKVTAEYRYLWTHWKEVICDRLVAIPQDTIILEGCSVRLNADPAGAHTDTEIIIALDRVGLWKSVLEDQSGLDAEISSSSVSLSKGQQQLLGLSRALLKVQNRKNSSSRNILLLDEPTSHVDRETDDKMQAVLRETPCLAACTKLTVAHRIKSIANADLAIVLDAGRIVEMGDPRDLIMRAGSVFAELSSGEKS